MIVCADSSFIVSNYIQDVHSPEAIRRMTTAPTIWISSLNRTELAHVLSQYVFRKQISPFEAQRAWDEFEEDCNAGIWALLDFPQRTWDTSIEIARKHGPSLGIRTLDGLHVAIALELRSQRFWTFDERQAHLAEGVGLDTNP